MNHEDASKYLVSYLRNPRPTGGYSTYGYDIYISRVVDAYLHEQGKTSSSANDREIRELSPHFLAAAWDLCRRGIIRPGVASLGDQSTTEGAAGGGYAITPFGRTWIAESDKDDFVPTEPERFARLIAKYNARFSPQFAERAQDAIRCYGAHPAVTSTTKAFFRSMLRRSKRSCSDTEVEDGTICALFPRGADVVSSKVSVSASDVVEPRNSTKFATACIVNFIVHPFGSARILHENRYKHCAGFLLSSLASAWLRSSSRAIVEFVQSSCYTRCALVHSCETSLAQGETTSMARVTSLLSQIELGDPLAADQLLPLVYDELRQLARAKLSMERDCQTLQPTALVHEAYLRLTDKDNIVEWDSRRHFFAAAALAMRRILVERARRKATVKHGGVLKRQDFDDQLIIDDRRATELLALDEALSELEKHDAQAAQVVQLRYFAGLSHQDAADALNISRRTADRLWVAAKTWLHRRMAES